jgi:hypothetical protein
LLLEAEPVEPLIGTDRFTVDPWGPLVEDAPAIILIPEME